MGKIRDVPEKLAFPSFSGRVIIDNYRGQMRFRSWPRKRGPKATPAQQVQRDWFKSANLRSKAVPGSQMATAIEAAKGTGLYPRDMFLRAMSTGFFELVYPDGTTNSPKRYFIEEVMFQGARLQLATNQAVPATTFYSVTYPLPVVDTAGFWSAAHPSRLTIPAGVTVVRLTGCIRATSATATRAGITCWMNGATVAASVDPNSVNFCSIEFDSGPLPVTTGDYFELKAYLGAARTLAAGPANFFGLEVLEAA